MGYPLYGSDMDRTVDPISAGLGWVVPPSKTGYIGADAVAAVRAGGTVTKLVGLTIEGAIPRHGMSVLREGVEVGKVASGSFSPTLETGIATAYVPAELSRPGTELQVEVRKKTLPAIVVKPPLCRQPRCRRRTPCIRTGRSASYGTPERSQVLEGARMGSRRRWRRNRRHLRLRAGPARRGRLRRPALRGDTLAAGDSFGEIESVKSVSELFAPLSGEIVEVNSALGDTPETVNADPHGAGWMVKVSVDDASELDALMSAEEYDAFIVEG